MSLVMYLASKGLRYSTIIKIFTQVFLWFFFKQTSSFSNIIHGIILLTYNPYHFKCNALHVLNSHLYIGLLP